MVIDPVIDDPRLEAERIESELDAEAILAIDPGPVESAYVLLRAGAPVEWKKVQNRDVNDVLDATVAGELAIEMIASYGMPVGREVFETCVWIGRYVERWGGDVTVRLVYRKEVKMHLCGSVKANDSNIRQALIDKFGPGKELAIGRKASPGPLYGMSGDCWAALGVAVTAAETKGTP